jgi:hypothetical protein
VWVWVGMCVCVHMSGYIHVGVGVGVGVGMRCAYGGYVHVGVRMSGLSVWVGGCGGEKRRVAVGTLTHQSKILDSHTVGTRVVVSIRKEPGSPKKARAARSRLSSSDAGWYTLMGGHDRAPHT